MTSLRSLLLVLTVAVSVAGFSAIANGANAAEPTASSFSSSPVTIYGAKWCSACRALERGLTDRRITFDVIDVDDNPSAYSRARAAAGASNSIPLTSVVRSSSTVWVVGADVDAVERAQKGE